MLEAKFKQAMSPIGDFIHKETSSGIVLVCAVLAAMAVANSPLFPLYDQLLHTYITLGSESYNLSYSLHHWINDGLMAFFFFVVGLEVKREILIGELSNLRQAMLPISMAIGGMLVPAGLYIIFTSGTEAVNGWGIPMATDIAFALGILALLGPRIPKTLIALLLAIAIVDDIGAVLVIAAFYTESIHTASLIAAAACFVLLALFNLLGIRHSFPYIIIGLILWVAMLKSGIHATLAGVLTALTIPARSSMNGQAFTKHLCALTDEFNEQIFSAREQSKRFNVLRNAKKQKILQSIEDSVRLMESPLQRIEHSLHGWVAFLIVPIFAFANAGIPVSLTDLPDIFSQGITIGIFAGLVIGKTVGISFTAWIVTRLGLSKLPQAVSFSHILGISMLAGIGFTMSIFIGSLAFTGGPEMLVTAKIGILAASLCAGVGGYALLYLSDSRPCE